MNAPHPESAVERHAAQGDEPRVPQSALRGNLIAYRTLVRKEVGRFLRIWPQTLLPSAVTMSLYFVIFGSLMGDRIKEMDGIPYISFIVPGLVMMAVITNSYSNVVSSFFSSKFQCFIEEMLVSPMSHATLLLGYVTGGVARGLCVGVLVTGVALFFTRLEVNDVGVTISIVFLTAVLFSIGGAINAIFARKFDDISIVPTFVLTPLTYLGGVFYSIELLPPFWRTVSLANPILYMVNAFRHGILGTSDIHVGLAFAIVIAFIAGLFGFALWLLARGVGTRT